MRRALLIVTLFLGSCAQGPIMKTDEAAGRTPIDELLGPRQYEGYAGVFLGSVGDRLWCQGLAPSPGLKGVFQHIHQGLHASLFDLEILENDRPLPFPPMTHQWYPSHVVMEADGTALHLEERKFVTRDDRAVDVVRLRNDSPEERRLKVKLRTTLAVQPSAGMLLGAEKQWGLPVAFAIAAGGFSPAKDRVRVHAAVNERRSGVPEPRASHTYPSDSVWAAVDGQYVSSRRWTCWESAHPTDWFEVNFGEPTPVERLVLDIFDDEAGVWAPKAYRVEVERDGALVEPEGQTRSPAEPAKGRNEVRFAQVTTRRVRVTFEHRPGKKSGLVEFEVYPEREVERVLLEREIVLAPRATESFAAVVAFADDAETAGARAVARDPQKLAEAHIAEYDAWFAQEVPRFECPDPWFERLWWYRWYVVRHCLADPKAGLLREPCFFEGRHAAWYPQVITYGHALQCAEARWLRDPKIAYGHLSAVLRNQFEGDEGFYPGMFPNVRVDRRVNHYYTEWIPRGLWDVFLVHPDRAYLEWALPRLEKNVDGILERFDADGDGLPTVLPQRAGEAHFHTGMEFQPSFFWFTQPPAFKDETPLERVDFACYLYASCRAVAEARRFLGKDPGDYERKADVIARAIADKMWDAQRRFHYSIHPETHEKALVEEIVGFYPYAFDVPVREWALERLFDPEQFWAPYPARSASKRSELYSQDEPLSCHWNGPSWPFANVLILEALANGIRRDAGVSRERYFDFLERYARAQFEKGDRSRPVVGEYYHSETGEWQTPVVDYFHSTYADVLIRHVAGLVPRADEKLEFHPIVDAWEWFRFEGVPYRGARLDIEWKRGEGFGVRRDGKLLFRRPRLERVVYDPATGRVTS
ncbi:MAG: discoidin domain-containing protein [Planctomycetes bacterium]|nr:discoidin domain-containing protein [Planctomycetota bacterium]